METLKIFLAVFFGSMVAFIALTMFLAGLYFWVYYLYSWLTILGAPHFLAVIIPTITCLSIAVDTILTLFGVWEPK